MSFNNQSGKPDRQENKRTILVVDDEYDIVNAIKIWLERQNFFVCAFTDPLLALEHFKHNSNIISLVLSDIRMPKMNGYQLVCKIKTLQPKVKVTLMSAIEIKKEEFSKILSSIEIGGIISKPIAMKDLASISKI